MVLSILGPRRGVDLKPARLEVRWGLRLGGGGGEGVEDGEGIGDVSALDTADGVGVGELEDSARGAELGRLGGYVCSCRFAWSGIGVRRRDGGTSW